MIVFATNNRHKLREIREILGDTVDVRGLDEIGCHEEIPETAETLEGNAEIKARFVAERFGCDCFADDTGLEVEALGGAPGVYSARYAGEGCVPADNVAKLLDAMAGRTDRRARFRTVIALLRDGRLTLFEGIVNGAIATHPAGSDGFGYDPVFVPEGDTRTFAEMTHEEKNAISHRGRAMAKLVGYLRSLT